MLIVLGLVLLLAEKLGRRERMVSDLTLKDALVIGGAQALALIPGSSRSGTTITAGMFLGLTREAAARFSFLLSIPAVLASGLFTLGDIGKKDATGHMLVGWTPTLIAAAVAFVVGYASIAWLLRYLTSHSTVVFSAYRVVVGLAVIGLLAGNVISSTK
jgi:undecaprenyl-diphosphatase